MQVIEILRQLNYHQHVLKSKGERHLFAKSSKGKLHCSLQLESNLKEVIEANKNLAHVDVVQVETDDTSKYSKLKQELIREREKNEIPEQLLKKS